MGKYDCWGPDHEDLTAQVVVKVTRTPKTPVLRVFSPDDADPIGKWKVTDIVCSQGHKNSFEGSGQP